MRKLISSGSTFESDIGYSRAVLASGALSLVQRDLIIPI